MIKKNLPTIAGIVLAFAIAIGGWVLMNMLIVRDMYRLSIEVTYFSVEIPTVARVQHDTTLQENEVRVVLNDMVLEEVAIIQTDGLMIPFRAVAEALGKPSKDLPEFAPVRDALYELGSYHVHWDSGSQTIYIFEE